MSLLKSARAGLVVSLLLVAGAGLALAGDHGHKRGKHHRQAAAAPNPTQQQVCGQCHMAYPPCLLPAASWKRIMAAPEAHFGTAITMSAAETKEIEAYLQANAADQAGGKRARKIMASLSEPAPLRPSQVPYILHKHRKISAEVFARPSVGGRANCRACHPGAAQGDFEDDRAIIPR